MSRKPWSALVACLVLFGVGACDGGEIVVFSAIQAGAAGTSTMAGSGGLPRDGGAAGDGAGGLTELAGNGGGGLGGSGGGGGDADKPCQSSDDCDPSWLCQKRDCADVGGVCLPRPSDDPVRKPVCGCDNITYWNDALRQQRGIPALLATSECRFGVRGCMSDAECGTGNICNRRLPDVSACSKPGTGQCWAVPSDCTGTSDNPHLLPCPPPPNSPQPACITTCQAMNSGAPYLERPQGYVCP